MEDSKIRKVITVISVTAIVGFIIYRVYKYQQLKSGNKTKDERNIKLVKQ